MQDDANVKDYITLRTDMLRLTRTGNNIKYE